MNLAHKPEELKAPMQAGEAKPYYPSIHLSGDQAKEFAKEFPDAGPGKETKAVVCLKVCRASVDEDGVDSLSLDVCDISPHKDHERPPKFEGMIGGILRQMKGEA